MCNKIQGVSSCRAFPLVALIVLLVLFLSHHDVGVTGAAVASTASGVADAEVQELPEQELMMGEMQKVVSSLNLTLNRVNEKLASKQKQLQELKASAELAKRLQMDVEKRNKQVDELSQEHEKNEKTIKQKEEELKKVLKLKAEYEEDLQKRELEIQLLLNQYEATKEQFDAVKSEIQSLRTKADTSDKLARELKKMELEVKTLKKNLSDNDLEAYFIEGVAEIGRVLESDILTGLLSDSMREAVHAARLAEKALESTFENQLKGVTNQRTSKFVAFLSSCLLLLLPIWLVITGLRRISSFFSARQHVLLFSGVNAVLCVMCLLSWALIGQDLLYFLYRGSPRYIAGYLFLFLFQVPLMLYLMARAIIESSSSREKIMLISSLIAYGFCVNIFRTGIWRPCMSQTSVIASPVSPVIYSALMILSVAICYMSIKARRASTHELLTQDVSRVVSDIESVASTEKLQ